MKEEKSGSLENLKNEARAFTGERNVKEWNRLREEYKSYYLASVISELDASGYINEWLKGR